MRAYDFSFDISKANPFGYTRTKVTTNLFNSLSILFPKGERYFIDAIRHYEESLPKHLLEEAKIFYKEEGKHSREHRKLNKMLEDAGVDIAMLEQRAFDKLMYLGHTPQERLMTTVCLEIFTAYGAELLLKIHKVVMKDDELSAMWRWHAKEESGEGHRSIAHKVLEHCCPVNKLQLSLWFVYVSIMLIVQTVENYREISKAS